MKGGAWQKRPPGAGPGEQFCPWLTYLSIFAVPVSMFLIRDSWKQITASFISLAVILLAYAACRAFGSAERGPSAAVNEETIARQEVARED